MQSQHQIDLIDRSKDPVKHNGKVYKYILSVIDVFSRLSWLVSMERKSSRQVVRSLRPHGSPDRLQSDRGPEFQGKLWSLCTPLQDQNDKIKTLSSPITGKGGAIIQDIESKDHVRSYQPGKEGCKLGV